MHLNNILLDSSIIHYALILWIALYYWSDIQVVKLHLRIELCSLTTSFPPRARSFGNFDLVMSNDFRLQQLHEENKVTIMNKWSWALKFSLSDGSDQELGSPYLSSFIAWDLNLAVSSWMTVYNFKINFHPASQSYYYIITTAKLNADWSNKQYLQHNKSSNKALHY